MNYRFLKHNLDFALAILCLILALPLFMLLATYLFLRLKQSPFFFQIRIGQGEEEFTIYKFRTVPDGWEIDNLHQLPADLRSIRSFGLDELPQLINILKGSMSFIGPRPLLPEYIDLYDSVQRKRHEPRPGIIGLAQVKGGNGLSWRNRLKWDVIYVRKLSLVLDLRILYLTLLNISRIDKGIVSPPFTGSKI